MNRKRVCIAGLESGVLGAHLTSFQARLEEGSETEGKSSIHLFVSGTNDGKRFRWPEPNETSLAIGDEVTFRILESDSPDEGVRHYPRQENSDQP